MKSKLLVLMLGLTIGFFIGSKAGPQPYRQLRDRVDSIRNRPSVKRAVSETESLASDGLSYVEGKASDALGSTGTE